MWYALYPQINIGKSDFEMTMMFYLAHVCYVYRPAKNKEIGVHGNALLSSFNRSSDQTNNMWFYKRSGHLGRDSFSAMGIIVMEFRWVFLTF